MLKRNFTFLLYIFIAVFCYNCKNDKKTPSTTSNEPEKKQTIFSREIIAESDFESCEEENCPSINVNYLIAEGNTPTSKYINEKNTTAIIEIFNASEDKPNANSVKKAIENFIDDYFTFQKEFPESPAEYEAELSQKLITQTDKILVIETNFYLFTGGAHGYGATRYLNFDANTGKFLTKNDLISDVDAFRAFVEKKFRTRYNIPINVNINSKGFFFENDTFALPENIAVTENEVLLTYNRYEAASYAQGELKFVFTKNEVAKWFNY